MMSTNDLYQQLISHYEFLIGPIPLAEEFLRSIAGSLFSKYQKGQAREVPIL
jgi:hypothetical protein